MSNDQEEFNDYLKAGFKPVITADGSYSLKQEGLGEEMHSNSGAMAESIFIYYSALELFFESCEDGDDVEILSIGLGLGYNEILTSQADLKSGKKLSFKLRSFEKEKALESLFMKRVEECESFPIYWSMFSEIDSALRMRVHQELKKSLNFEGLFDKDIASSLENKKRIILFDAYSNKTSKELWTEKLLTDLFERSDKGSVFTTYAATGVLNRALKATGFKNLKRRGFLHKRESCLAIKA